MKIQFPATTRLMAVGAGSRWFGASTGIHANLQAIGSINAAATVDR